MTELQTYNDKVSGETLYVRFNSNSARYYKDKAGTIRHRVDGPAIAGRDLRGDELKRLHVNGVEIDRDYLQDALNALKTYKG